MTPRYLRLILSAAAVLLGTLLSQAAVETTDFTYNPAEGLKLTRYADTNRTGKGDPCIIFAFGGGFTHGERNDARYQDYFRFMAERGYVVCTIDYRTTLASFTPQSGSDGIQQFGMALVGAIQTATSDYISATAYILGQATSWGIDPRLIVASGSSAGAITALQAEYTLVTDRPEALPAGFNYAACVTFAGAIISQGEPQMLAQFCPSMLFHGDADCNVPYDALTLGPIGLYGSHYLATRFKDSGCAGAFHTQMGADHSMALSPMTSNLYDIAGFLQRILSGAPKSYDWTVVTVPDTAPYRTDFTITDFIRANQ